ncbi:MAG TPA: RagB/SusD family nutrient uptake outer membrane protein [Dinghuibacter sp.]|jgi:hypothetical protein|uniref:RagB/SusD family nutrient uptake outer membrane protein n=1 Tax=Dinghuibacter sp. TaxID=2024697 RepID=UPI002CEC0CD5|nr:RagB/SusD family nutrient uptake outer membrane protein [Dinghuibacter sp.]HTJ10543.1 RagB/SusD family nutrient uptake outer membrane protein [Dinghuibacter sp.]
MKKTLITILTAAIAATGCKKQLMQVAPQDAITNQAALTDTSAATSLYIGVYNRFRGEVSNLFFFGEMRSDIWCDGITQEAPGATYVQYSDQQISALQVPSNTTNWGGFYNVLYQVNNVIQLFPQTKLSDFTRTKYLADMYGLRAYIYYVMLRTWGDVPLVTQPINSIGSLSSLYMPRTSSDSVMLQIKSDIEQSLTLYNGNNALPANRVFWSRLATLTLKGDAYIWSATNMNGGTGDLTTAQAALQEVEALQGAKLGLQPNYADIFDPTKKASEIENIFAVDYELSQAQNTSFTDFTVNNTQATSLVINPYTTPTIVSVAYPYVAGASRAGLTQTLINQLFAAPADQRITGTLTLMYGNTPPNYTVKGCMLTKWIGRVNAGAQLYDNNFPIYRYADVLLLMAEAKAKLGQDPSPEINLIRARAYGSSYPVYTNGTPDANLQAILGEYLREFIGEGKRWWALRRAGDAYVYDFINPKYLSAATASSGKGPTLLMPLSLGDLNSNPLLKQTPGY